MEPHLFIILVIGLSMDAFVVSIGKGLSDWDASCRRFLKVIPVGYKMLLKDDSN